MNEEAFAPYNNYMAIRLLIDTCNLRRLASTKEFSSLLQQLVYLVKGKYITLLAPAILKTEWAIM